MKQFNAMQMLQEAGFAKKVLNKTNKIYHIEYSKDNIYIEFYYKMRRNKAYKWLETVTVKAVHLTLKVFNVKGLKPKYSSRFKLTSELYDFLKFMYSEAEVKHLEKYTGRLITAFWDIDDVRDIIMNKINISEREIKHYYSDDDLYNMLLKCREDNAWTVFTYDDLQETVREVLEEKFCVFI